MNPSKYGPGFKEGSSTKATVNRKKYRKHKHAHGANAAPANVSLHQWKDMLNMSLQNVAQNVVINPIEKSSDEETKQYPDEIGELFKKRECSKYIASLKESQKCGCGRLEGEHSSMAIFSGKQMMSDTEFDKNDGADENWSRAYNRGSDRWSIKNHTTLIPTDAYGTIEFQGGPRPIKAQYVRLSFDTDCSKIIHLLENIWQIPPPKLIISVYGGTSDFNLQTKLARIFRNGLVKAASTTGAWVITSGCDDGVTKQVAAALENAQASIKHKAKIVSIGIAPWGLLKRREDFINKSDFPVLYRKTGSGYKSRFITLNNRHSYFLLTDNGTIGKSGSEVILRRRLEAYINEKQTIGNGQRTVPVVCVMLEGGAFSIRTALQYVTSIPRTPVVVCDGSGRASDLIAFTHQYIQEDGKLPEGVRPQLLALIEKTFQSNKTEAELLVNDLLACVSQKRMLTIFRSGAGEHRRDLDHAILTALLKGYDLSPPEQLSLALAWNRSDIARSEIFVHGVDWKTEDLHNIMMEALMSNRVDFVRLLLENGVDMQHFLTIARLEELYNTDKGPTNTLYYIVRDVTKIKTGYRYKLPHIGLAMEKLIGNGFKSFYTSPEFRVKYGKYRLKLKETEKAISRESVQSKDDPISTIFPVDIKRETSNGDGNAWRSAIKSSFAQGLQTRVKSVFINVDEDHEKTKEKTSPPKAPHSAHGNFHFRYPFSELLIWAVLTKRHEMALCVWQHGEEAMAKSLVACRLYKSLSKEAAEDYLELEVCEELRKNAEEFRTFSLDLLDCCYRADDDKTLQLLTYELKCWGNETCLSLAVVANNKQFLSHPCCQMLLADLWHGGMRIRSHSNLKVICGIICPFSIYFLEFKSKEELLLQPQTALENLLRGNESSDSEGESTDSSIDSSSSSETDSSQELYGKQSFFGSTQSIHFSSILPNRLRRSKKGEHKHRRQSVGSITSIKEQTRPRKSSHTSDVNDAAFKTKQISRRRMSSTCKEILDPARLTHLQNVANETKKEYKSKNRTESVISGKKQEQNVVSKPLIPNKSKQINIKRKLYEFFFAPITSFWTWFLSFIAFMTANTYVLLIKTPDYPTALEWVLFSYVLAFGFEELRKLFMSEPTRIRKKLTFFFSDTWNWLTMSAVLGYVIGFAIRSASPESAPIGRIVLAVDFSIWTLKILDYLTVNQKFGQYITMVGKMITAMSYHVTLLTISLLAFGLVRQSITFPNEEFSFILIRNIFYKPYFMLYGEVYAGEIDTCGDDGINCHPGSFIPPALMVVFLLVANLLLISMLMATFNHIFDGVNRMAKQYWLFQRYHQVMKYESSPVIPPPFTLVYHLYWVVKYMWYQNVLNIRGLPKKLGIVTDNKSKPSHLFDCSLKLFLDIVQVEKLHDFEEECMDILALQKEHSLKLAMDSKITNTSENTDTILSRMADVIRSESTMKESVNGIENRLNSLEIKETELLDQLKSITDYLIPNFDKIRKSTAEPDNFSDHMSDHDGSLKHDTYPEFKLDVDTQKMASRRRSRMDYTSITDAIDVKIKDKEHDYSEMYTEDDKDEYEYDEYSN
uniref:LSDAT_euk domain-containing protein n=1 Tax=Rhabditophanes sp. KR3021 TaxID=114890 RepID=A0AC35TMW1_9BILA